MHIGFMRDGYHLQWVQNIGNGTIQWQKSLFVYAIICESFTGTPARSYSFDKFFNARLKTGELYRSFD